MIVRTPVRLQSNEVECGAICLGIVLSYHRIDRSIIELRNICDVGLREATLDQIRRGAEALGCECTVVKRGIASLRNARVPLIVFWELRHFVVLEGVRGGRVRINDPAIGRRQISIDAFEKHYTGVCLDVTVPRCIVQGARARSRARGIPDFFASSRLGPGLAIGALCGITALFLEMAAAGASRVFYDFIVEQAMARWGFALLLVSAAIVAARLMLRQSSGEHSNRVATQAAVEAKSSFVRRFCDEAERPRGEHLVAEAIGRLADLDRGLRSRIGNRQRLGEALVVLGLGTGVVLAFAPLVALVQLVPYLALFAVTLLRAGGDREHSASAAIEEGEYSALLWSGRSGFARFYAMGMEACILRCALPAWSRKQRINFELARRQEVVTVARRFLQIVLPGCLLFSGCFLLASGKTTYGVYSFASIVALVVTARAEWLAATVATVASDAAALRRAAEVVEAHAGGSQAGQVQDNLQRIGGQSGTGALIAANVCFRYARTQANTLHNVSLKVAEGEIVCINGPSGAGKTTLMEILAGVRKPTQGTVWRGVDGAGKERRARLVYGDSDFVTGSVVDFVAGLHPVDPQRVLDVLEKCELRDRLGFFVDSAQRESMSDLGLSRGEIQRLFIAQALYANDGCILFDEAFCHLSRAQTERILTVLRRDRLTVVLASHRSEIQELCDRVMNLAPTAPRRHEHLLPRPAQA